MTLVFTIGEVSYDLNKTSSRQAFLQWAKLQSKEALGNAIGPQLKSNTLYPARLIYRLSPKEKCVDLWGRGLSKKGCVSRKAIRIGRVWFFLPRCQDDQEKALPMIVSHYLFSDHYLVKKFQEDKIYKMLLVALWLGVRKSWGKSIQEKVQQLIGLDKRSLNGALRSLYDHVLVLTQDVYGEVSTDSDSDDEAAWQESPGQDQKSDLANQAIADVIGLKREGKVHLHKRISERLTKIWEKKQEVGRGFFVERTLSPRAYDASRQRREDLKELNHWLSKKNDSPMPKMLSKFVLVGWRGVHYFKDRFSRKIRRYHASSEQVELYAPEVYWRLGYSTWPDHALGQEAEATASCLREELIALRQSRPLKYNGYSYRNRFDLFQQVYSTNYDGFARFYNKYLKKDKQDIQVSPFVSTSARPSHPTSYAFGDKIYKGHESGQYLSRWQRNGQGLDRTVGKVYCFVHKLSDYLAVAPSHVTAKIMRGDLVINNIIAAEMEVSFLAHIDASAMYDQKKAKMPSFYGDYKAVYLQKYGLDHSSYQWMKKSMNTLCGHLRQRFEQFVREYVMIFHKAIKRLEVGGLENEGFTVIYETHSGFSLMCPDVATTASPKQKAVISKNRESRRYQVKGKSQSLFVEEALSLDADEPSSSVLGHN